MQVNSAAPPWRSNPSTSYPSSHVHVGPAFTTVSARRNLPRPSSPGAVYVPPPPPPTHVSSDPPPKPQQQKVAWPESVRQYVQRSFIPENAIPGIEREEMEAKLKDVIGRATESNALWTTDWDHMPLPQRLIEEEKKRKMTATTAIPWSTPIWNHQAPPPTSQSQQSVDPLKRTQSKKRKSSELDPGESSSPPWRKTNNRNVFEDRITYPPNDARQRQDNNSKASSKSQAKLEKRKKRFDNVRNGYSSPGHSSSRDDSPAGKGRLGPIVGRCVELEKSYLRLTDEPKPEKVRPLYILRQTLDLLKRKWKSESNYAYICDQFKSLRQDMTVQHIKNEFTVDVYEIHARIALEKGDIGEYNQCQTQLRGLYQEKLGGHPMEFLAYRILYFINIQNRTELNDVLAHLTPADKEHDSVKHALDVRSALAAGNYHRFFQLYMTIPDMGAYIVDRFIVRERLAALSKICKAYPEVPLRFISEELAFEGDEEARVFLLNYVNESVLPVRNDAFHFVTKNLGSIFEQARAEAFRVVDIKGQL